MDGFAGAIGISDSRGKGSPVLNVCEVLDGYNKTYIMWYLRYLAYQDVFLATATGIRERSCDLRWNKISNLDFVIPPENEQVKIAEIISELFYPINELAKLKAEKDDLLKQYKKAIVTDADRVMIGALADKLRGDPRLANMAMSSDPQIFAESIFPQAFNIAAQDSYIESQETYTSLFEDQSKYDAIMHTLAEMLYREMRQPGNKK